MLGGLVSDGSEHPPSQSTLWDTRRNDTISDPVLIVVVITTLDLILGLRRVVDPFSG